MRSVRLIQPKRLPPGVQSLKARVPMRLASCQEVGCPALETGWSEVTTHDGNRVFALGHLEPEEAGATYGFGPQDQPPAVTFKQPGTPCPRIHKVPSGLPPVYVVDGRAVTETEWKDRLGEGAYTVQYLRTRG